MRRFLVILFFSMCYFTVSAEEVTFLQSPEELIQEARSILKGNTNFSSAIPLLNSVLLMKTNQYTQEAQELIGQAYEDSGLFDKAKAEYSAYLTLYPSSENSTRIRQKLISLEIAIPKISIDNLEHRKPKLGQEKSWEGTISEYYYLGSNSPKLFSWNTEQSALMSNARMSALYRDDQYQTKMVFRYAKLDNFTNSVSNKALMSLGYIDFEDTFLDYGIRVGRQNPTSGVMGRYDGVTARYIVNDNVSVKVLAGTPYTGRETAKRNFYGVSAEWMLFSSLTGNVYYNNQTADGLLERSAIGSEFRYFKNENAFAIITDYDMVYNSLNSIMVQGSTQVKSSNFYFLLDRRKSPMLFASNALILGSNRSSGQPFSYVKDLVNNSGLTVPEIYNYISSASPTASVFVIGASTALNSKWNINVDLQTSNVSATQDTTFIPSLETQVSPLIQPSSGNSYGINVQMQGVDVFAKGHSVNAISILSKDKTSSLTSFTLVTGRVFKDFRIDVLSMASFHSQLNIQTRILSPSVRMNYKIDNKTSVEMQYSIARKTVFDRILEMKSITFGQTFFIGWKYDL